MTGIEDILASTCLIPVGSEFGELGIWFGETCVQKPAPLSQNEAGLPDSHTVAICYRKIRRGQTPLVWSRAPCFDHST